MNIEVILIIFRYTDRNNNRYTLEVRQRPDLVITYSHFMGWQHTGVGYALPSTINTPLPRDSRNFANIHDLHDRIIEILAEARIAPAETGILNELTIAPPITV